MYFYMITVRKDSLSAHVVCEIKTQSRSNNNNNKKKINLFNFSFLCSGWVLCSQVGSRHSRCVAAPLPPTLSSPTWSSISPAQPAVTLAGLVPAACGGRGRSCWALGGARAAVNTWWRRWLLHDTRVTFVFCAKCRRQWTPACGFTCCLRTLETTRLSGDISPSSGDMRTVRDDGESTGLSVNRFTRGKMRLSDFTKRFWMRLNCQDVHGLTVFSLTDIMRDLIRLLKVKLSPKCNCCVRVWMYMNQTFL